MQRVFFLFALIFCVGFVLPAYGKDVTAREQLGRITSLPDGFMVDPHRGVIMSLEAGCGRHVFVVHVNGEGNVKKVSAKTSGDEPKRVLGFVSISGPSKLEGEIKRFRFLPLRVKGAKRDAKENSTHGVKTILAVECAR
jgi:hypothetical protein